MKRLILSAILVVVAFIAYSQENLLVSFPDFNNWAKQIKLSGYPFVESEQDESEYSAMFGSGPDRALQLRLFDISRFSEYKSVAKQATEYTWHGYLTVYYEFSGVTFLSLQLPEMNLAISFGIKGKTTKSALEEIAAKSNINSLKPSNSAQATTLPSGIKWPEVISSDMRLSNVLSIESQGTDGTYKDVIQVTASMNPDLIASVQVILNKYKGELSLTSTDKLDFICSDAENLGQLQQNFKPGTPVTFMYYIK